MLFVPTLHDLDRSYCYCGMVADTRCKICDIPFCYTCAGFSSKLDNNLEEPYTCPRCGGEAIQIESDIEPVVNIPIVVETIQPGHQIPLIVRPPVSSDLVKAIVATELDRPPIIVMQVQNCDNCGRRITDSTGDYITQYFGCLSCKAKVCRDCIQNFNLVSPWFCKQHMPPIQAPPLIGLDKVFDISSLSAPLPVGHKDVILRTMMQRVVPGALISDSVFKALKESISADQSEMNAILSGSMAPKTVQLIRDTVYMTDIRGIIHTFVSKKTGYKFVDESDNIIESDVRFAFGYGPKMAQQWDLATTARELATEDIPVDAITFYAQGKDQSYRRMQMGIAYAKELVKKTI